MNDDTPPDTAPPLGSTMTPSDDAVLAALQELVRLKKLKDRLDVAMKAGATPGMGAEWDGYHRDKPLAWAAADAALAAHQSNVAAQDTALTGRSHDPQGSGTPVAATLHQTSLQTTLEAAKAMAATGASATHIIELFAAHQTRERDAPSDAAELQKQLVRLYLVAQDVCACTGFHGSIEGRDDRISRLMDALAAIDGGSQDGAPEWMRQSIEAWNAAQFLSEAAQQLALSAPRETLGDSTEAAVQVPAVAATRGTER